MRQISGTLVQVQEEDNGQSIANAIEGKYVLRFDLVRLMVGIYD